jgi:hypothetical protein
LESFICIVQFPGDTAPHTVATSGCHMAYELVTEVFDHAPDMTPAERCVLLAIAEKSRVYERAAAIDGAVMLRRCCVDERGLRHALVRLAERGLEVREPIGQDRLGRPVYAVPGRSRVFSLPHLTPAAGLCRCYRCRQADARGFLPQTTTSEADPGVLLPIAEGEKEDVGVRQADMEVLLGGHTGPPGGRGSPPLPSGEPSPYVGGDLLSRDDALALTRSAVARARERWHT